MPRKNDNFLIYTSALCGLPLNMQLDLPTILVIGFAILALLVFIILRNRKDKKEMEEQMNEDYEKPRHHEDDMDTSV